MSEKYNSEMNIRKILISEKEIQSKLSEAGNFIN